jgi:signal transduction histidine kinase/ligand-binding sensor domain-containing protein/DNA-binding response OmpR family regulator
LICWVIPNVLVAQPKEIVSYRYFMQKFILLLTGLLWYLPLFGQHQNLKFDALSIEDGFPEATVLSFLRDSKGFMWFGTQYGLVRYDGEDYKTYYTDKSDSTQLFHGHVFHLFEDSRGKIWISSGVPIETGKTIQVFDPKTEKFTRLNFRPLHQGWLYNQLDGQNYILEDEKGVVWVKCYQSGIYRIEESASNQFAVTNFRPSLDFPNHTSADSVSVLFLDSQQIFWVGTRNGLYTFDRHRGKFTPYSPDKRDMPDQVTGIVEDKRGNLWVNYERKGLCVLDRDNQQLVQKWAESNPTPWWFNARYLLLDSADNIWMIRQREGSHLHASLDQYNLRTGKTSRYFASGTDHVDLWYFFHQIDHNGTLWVSHKNNIYRYDPQSTTFELVKSFSQSIQNLYRDKNQNLWVASWQQGVWRHHPSNQKVNIISKRPLLNESVAWVNTCVEDNQGNIIVSGDDGIYQYSLDKTKNAVSERKIMDGKCNNIIISADGSIWASCYNQDIVEIVNINRENHSVKRYLLASNIESIRSITEIENQRIFVGTRTNGLFLLDKKSEKFIHYTHNPDDSTSVSSNVLNHIVVDQEQIVWVYNRLGFHIFKPMSGEFIRLDHKSVSDHFENIHALSENDQGYFWIGAVDGLSLYDPFSGKILKKYLVNDGFPTKEINEILIDRRGNLWLGTRFGLVNFNVREEKFRVFDNTDGLPSNFLFTSCVRSNGDVVFGGNAGVFTFSPYQLVFNNYVPTPAITELRLFNQSVDIGEDVLSKSISYSREITLKHNQNIISFTYSALSLVSPDKNQYAYFMEGVDRDWNYVGNQNYASYSGLSPGTYVFQLKASNNDGVWNEKPTTLAITILPPWWQTNWAYALYALLIIFLLYTLRQYTVKRERLKHALELQTMEAEKMHELDHLKSRFFANISHEFRTPLTLILGPLDKFILQSQDNSSEQSTYRMMQRNARRLLRLVNQLLDLSKLESGSMKLDTKPQPIVPFLKSIALSFASLAERRQIAYQFQFPGGNPVVYFDADKLEKIVSNLLSNAFKFTPDNGEVRVSIQLEEFAHSTQQRRLELKVQDSGPGIPPALTEHIFNRFYQVESTLADEQAGSGIGLSLVSELVELHGGEISVENTPGSGACFRLSLPVEVADYEEISLIEATPPSSLSPNEPATDEPRAEPDKLPEHDPSKPLVLVVEDNADVRTFIRETLQAQYRLEEAPNGMIGLQLALETVPDLILSDVMMPEMDGVTLSQKLKADERTSHIPVILLTAKASGADKINGLETGVDDYMIKPFQSDELTVRIYNLIENRRRLRERYSQEITLQPTAVTVTSVDQQFLERMKKIVEGHLPDTTFGVEAFSEEAGLSRVQLFRKLKALTDLSPSEFIKTMRLKRAANLLAQGAGTVGDVAFQVGFSDPSYFTKAFQKQYGQTPSEYHPSTIS